ncbi:hypothetical protein Peur_031661 [Populus x canadensis]
MKKTRGERDTYLCFPPLLLISFSLSSTSSWVVTQPIKKLTTRTRPCLLTNRDFIWGTKCLIEAKDADHAIKYRLTDILVVLCALEVSQLKNSKALNQHKS